MHKRKRVKSTDPKKVKVLPLSIKINCIAMFTLK